MSQTRFASPASGPTPSGTFARWINGTAWIAADTILLVVVAVMAGTYWLGRVPPAQGLGRMAAVLALGHVVATAWRPADTSRRAALLRAMLGNLAAAGIYAIFRSQIGPAVSRVTYGEYLGILTLIQVPLRILVPWSGADGFRAGLALAATLSLHTPLLTHGTVGAGDAAWYRTMTADFVEQWREGIFPVFVGQTEYAFNGAVSPVRLAPGLQHLAGLVDLATAQSLPYAALLNLTLVACFAVTTVGCYVALRAMQPRLGWLALGLALLVATCPGVLALAYAGDLFMSVAALPFLPVAFYGAWRTLAVGDRRGMLIMVSGLAALWYCHPPIALWGTVIAATTQVFRLSQIRTSGIPWRQWTLGAGVFVLLTAGTFVSVGTLGMTGNPAYRPVLVENLQVSFAGALRPVGTVPTQLSDYQLGWCLWAVLLLGLVASPARRSRRTAPGLALGAVVLLLFLVPLPGVLPALWRAVPQAVCDLTYMWPMQRFYAILAPFAVVLLVAATGDWLAGRWWRHGTLALVVGASLLWSAREAGKFLAHARRTTTPAAAVIEQLRPENRLLTRYSFNPFPLLPPYYTHGHIDPLLPHRLLRASDLAVLADNYQVVEDPARAGRVVAAGPLRAIRPDATQPTLVIEPSLTIEPGGRRYVLTWETNFPEFTGALTIRGTRLNRSYWMPDSAYDSKLVAPSRAFATLPGRTHSVTLWTDGPAPETLALTFFFTTPPPPVDPTDYGRYTLRRLEPASLPVQVEGWAPYRAFVTVGESAFLEGPQMYVPGYAAEVNGKRVATRRSPNAQVMIPLSAGENRVVLRYPGTLPVRLAYWTSLGTFALVAGTGLSRLLRRQPSDTRN